MSERENGGRPARLTRVVLRNYRSIAACDVRLGALTFLVGPNGSGKSNFLDALRLVSESLNTSLDYALRSRGGVGEVRRRSSGHPTSFGVRLDFVLPGSIPGHFAFEIGARSGGAFVVQTEQCQVGAARYRVSEGRIEVEPGPVSPPAVSDRLYLVNAAGLPEFRAPFDLLRAMGLYNLIPDRFRQPQPPDNGDLLARDGINLASVLDRLAQESGDTVRERIDGYLSRIVSGLEAVESRRFGSMTTLEFRLRVKGQPYPWVFPATSMSEGTLRALGILVAIFQAKVNPSIRLIGIDEPETALHPAAAGVLRDALREGARSIQVVVTSHSPELLDDREISDEAIRAVVSVDGTTKIAPVDDVTRGALRERLFTPGELLRANQLEPDLSAVPEPGQLDLFEQDRS